MALLTMILRKMVKNCWLQLNLWLGLTVCVALFSSMPLYSHAILQRTLLKELQLQQQTTNLYTGMMRISTSVSTKLENKSTKISQADRYMSGIPQRFGLDSHIVLAEKYSRSFKVYASDASEQEKKKITHVSIGAISEPNQYFRLIDGRMPDPKRNDGVYEALVSQQFMLSLKRDLDVEFLGEIGNSEQKIRIVPVGIIDSKPDPYSEFKLVQSGKMFYIDYGQFGRDIINGGKIGVSNLQYRFALDYGQMNIDRIPTYIRESNRVVNYMNSLGVTGFKFNALETMATYEQKKEQLNVILWSLYSPVILMLAFYLYMSANLIIDKQKIEISVLRSRGASRLQIMVGYTAEGLLLGLTALAAGPFVGLYFTKILGASSGFLEFVNRASLQVALNSSAYKIGAIAVAGSLILMLLPAFIATRVSIVNHKQQMAHGNKLSFWHKTFLDIILVGVAVYMLNSFQGRMGDLRKLALQSDSLRTDPLLFLMPALFVLGGGLLVLRIYPWFIRLIYWMGRRFWPPALYSTLVQISRSSGQYLTIMVFLIMTVAIGLFSANAARTINGNMEDKIRYETGADMVLEINWENDAPPPMMGAPAQPAVKDSDDQSPAESKRVQYTEPPFLPMTKLSGVESAARVFGTDKAFINVAGGDSGTSLIGIDTYEFGQTTWMRGGLLNHPINAYLNLIASDHKAVLISRSIADQLHVKEGDRIGVKWSGLDETGFIVYGIIDYWPGWNPLPQSGGSANSEEAKVALPKLVVGHLSYIQNNLALEPYKIWFKLKDGATSKQVYDELAQKKIQVVSLSDTNQELIKSQNDPFRLAINGVMTLGFVISMLISFFGYLLFWILTLSGRTLQYGVLRAIGISFSQIVGMLVSEQILTSGAAILIGVLIGNTVSDLFVPLFEMSFNPSEQVPPFQIIHQLSDYLQLYGTVAFMLTIGLAILGIRLSRIKIHQALKLGEE
ncbi:ABC transporter permease [Cohnella sp.]|uniref:ABC transporter permease n=1 Tax=Cohnella sp. TaxID=1883426 RepID=UPI00356861BC